MHIQLHFYILNKLIQYFNYYKNKELVIKDDKYTKSKNEIISKTNFLKTELNKSIKNYDSIVLSGGVEDFKKNLDLKKGASTFLLSKLKGIKNQYENLNEILGDFDNYYNNSFFTEYLPIL